MSDEDFNKRCLENYSDYTCKDCKHYIKGACGVFDSLDVYDSFTCKRWETK